MSESLTIQSLNDRWAQVQAQQGVIGKLWNGVKEVTNLGQSASDCDSMLEKYQNGEISLDEAMEYIEGFETKQKDMTNLIANIATGVGAIALATGAMVMTGGTSIGWCLAMLKGAPIGAAIKTGLKAIDRATNDVKGDVLDGKEIIKDAVSGAVTGTTSAVSSHIFAGVTKASLKTSLINGAKCGLACGGLSGASNYLTDTVLDEDKKFSFGELTKTTATSAFVSGTVGAVVGGSVYGAENLIGQTGMAFKTVADKSADTVTRNANTVLLSKGETIARDSVLSSSRKVLNNAERQLLNI